MVEEGRRSLQLSDNLLVLFFIITAAHVGGFVVPSAGASSVDVILTPEQTIRGGERHTVLVAVDELEYFREKAEAAT